MSYLLDRKVKRNKFVKYAIFTVVLFILIYFRSGVSSGLSYVSSFVFHPIVTIGNSVGGSFSNIGTYFYSKQNLATENENLRIELSEKRNELSDHNSILDENIKMKEILGRKGNKDNLVLAAILSKPNQSLYDTLVIDAGSKNGILVGQKVFAIGNVPIGRIAEVYPNSSKVILYSSPGEKTEVVIPGKDTFMEVVGRGGGNFEMLLPHDLVLEKGTEATLPGLIPATLGIVQTILSDPRDAFQKALLSSPVNIQELKFVEIEK